MTIPGRLLAWTLQYTNFDQADDMVDTALLCIYNHLTTKDSWSQLEYSSSQRLPDLNGLKGLGASRSPDIEYLTHTLPVILESWTTISRRSPRLGCQSTRERGLEDWGHLDQKRRRLSINRL